MRLLGIDYGKKRIGVALSDENIQMAFPHSTILNEGYKKSARVIKKICNENKAGKIILGKSFDYQGRPNPIMKDIEKFRVVLEKEIDLEIEYQDEILTTQEARRVPQEGGARPPFAEKRKPILGRAEKTEKTDASAAAIILQSFIDAHPVL